MPRRLPLRELRFFDRAGGADVTEATLAALQEACPELLHAVTAGVDVFPQVLLAEHDTTAVSEGVPNPGYASAPGEPRAAQRPLLTSAGLGVVLRPWQRLFPGCQNGRRPLPILN